MKNALRNIHPLEYRIVQNKGLSRIAQQIRGEDELESDQRRSARPRGRRATWFSELDSEASSQARPLGNVIGRTRVSPCRWPVRVRVRAPRAVRDGIDEPDGYRGPVRARWYRGRRASIGAEAKRNKDAIRARYYVCRVRDVLAFVELDSERQHSVPPRTNRDEFCAGMKGLRARADRGRRERA